MIKLAHLAADVDPPLVGGDEGLAPPVEGAGGLAEGVEVEEHILEKSAQQLLKLAQL